MMLKKLINYTSVTVFICLLILIQCTPSPPALAPSPTWEGITIGQTTEKEVRKLLGEPDTIAKPINYI